MPLVSNDTVFLQPEIQSAPVAYLCKAKTAFEAAGKIVNESVVESVISLQVEQCNAEGYIVVYRVADNYWPPAGAAMGKISAFIRQMAALMNELVLQVDFSGNITTVLNKEDIWQNWLLFKSSIVKNFDFNPRIEKEMTAQWEKEFNQLENKLRTGIPYSLFFHSLYGEKKLFNGVYRDETITVPSKLFYGINLICGQQEKTKAGEKDSIDIQLAIEMEAFDQPLALVKQKLQFVYNMDVEDSIAYFYRQQYQYRLQAGTGSIQTASGSILESINDHIIFRQEYEAARIGDQ